LRTPDESVLVGPDNTSQIVLTFDDNRLAATLFGQYGQNLALIERRLGIVANSRGNQLTLGGPREACEQARRVLETLYERLKHGDELVQGDVDGTIRLALSQGSLFDFDPAAARENFEEINLRKRRVRARTPAQDAYLRALKRHALVFSTGPAGTGKTWLAVAHAIQLFERKEVDRIILSRPAVEAGERLGFLPGDMREKVDPYLRPIYDALYDLMDARIVERALQSTEIEIAPLAFMRGRTLSNAAVILDEAQNTTAMQMKMLLTRLGENSRMVVNGDPSQVDLPSGQTSGLAQAVRLLEGVEGIGHVTFTAADVVRHELVARIVEAYDKCAPRSTLTIDVVLDSGLWRKSGKGGAIVRRTVAQAAAALAIKKTEVAIVLTDDLTIRQLNRQWRGIDRATNVLSFPVKQTADEQPHLGDIVLAYETIAREARDQDKPFADHVAHLAVHGFLHLVGHDHERSKDATAMERLERDILRQLAIPDPYRRPAKRPRKA
jgi:phosphate starvation-inducible PhoH-like protein